MIPLRPELVSFMDVKALGAYSCCSALLRRDVRDADAWRLLATALYPQPGAQAETEREMMARVRSQTRRRHLASYLSQPASRPPSCSISYCEDFTYFVRIEEDLDGATPIWNSLRRKLIWEGDLRCDADTSGEYIRLDLSDVWRQLSESWEEIVEYLASSTQEDDYDYLRELVITVVAIRNVDQAMVSIGSFSFDDACGDIGADHQYYSFDPREPLFSCIDGQYHLDPRLLLHFTHDETGGSGTLDCIELRLQICSKSQAGVHNRSGLLDDLTLFQFEYLLSHLAGMHHANQTWALCEIRSWYNDVRTQFGSLWVS